MSPCKTCRRVAGRNRCKLSNMIRSPPPANLMGIKPITMAIRASRSIKIIHRGRSNSGKEDRIIMERCNKGPIIYSNNTMNLRATRHTTNLGNRHREIRRKEGESLESITIIYNLSAIIRTVISYSRAKRH